MAAALFVLVPIAVSSDQGEEAANRDVLLASGEWPPYAGPSLPGYGCDSRVITESFALAGIHVQYTFLPWARGLLLSRNGLVDGTFEWENTEEQRKNHFVSSEPVSRQEWVLFQRRETSVNWRWVEDLRHLRIGLTIGYIYSEAFKAMQAKYPATFTRAPSDLLNFRMLLNHRIDLFPMERSVGQYLLKTNFTPGEQAALVIHSKPLCEFTPHLLLSRAVAGNERRIRLFDQGIRQLRASGRYREIMAACSSENP